MRGECVCVCVCVCRTGRVGHDGVGLVDHELRVCATTTDQLSTRRRLEKGKVLVESCLRAELVAGEGHDLEALVFELVVELYHAHVAVGGVR